MAKRIVDVPAGAEIVVYDKASGNQVPQLYSTGSNLPTEPPPELSFGGALVLVGILGLAYLCFRCGKNSCKCD